MAATAAPPTPAAITAFPSASFSSCNPCQQQQQQPQIIYVPSAPATAPQREVEIRTVCVVLAVGGWCLLLSATGGYIRPVRLLYAGGGGWVGWAEGGALSAAASPGPMGQDGANVVIISPAANLLVHPCKVPVPPSSAPMRSGTPLYAFRIARAQPGFDNFDKNFTSQTPQRTPPTQPFQSAPLYPQIEVGQERVKAAEDELFGVRHQLTLAEDARPGHPSVSIR